MKKKLEQTHTGGDLLAGESFLSGLVEGLLELQVQQCPRRKLVTALTSGGTTEMGTSNVSPQSLSPPPNEEKEPPWTEERRPRHPTH